MSYILLTVKFGGSVPGTIIIGQHTVSEKPAKSTSTFITSTNTPGSKVNDSLIDYATYAIVAIAGFLILLFVTVLVGTILFFCDTKDKKGRYR